MPVSDVINYIIKGPETSQRRHSPGDALVVYESFAKAYGEANVHLVKEQIVYEVIFPDELRTLADQEKRFLEERRLADKERQA